MLYSELKQLIAKVFAETDTINTLYNPKYLNELKMLSEECYIFIADGMVIIKLKEGSERFIISWNENFIAEIREYEEE